MERRAGHAAHKNYNAKREGKLQAGRKRKRGGAMTRRRHRKRRNREKEKDVTDLMETNPETQLATQRRETWEVFVGTAWSG